MKLLKITTAVLLVVFIISQIYITMSIFKTEQQKYTLLQSLGDIEIRFYPSATLATIQMNARSYKEFTSFVMPEAYNTENLPKPTDSKIVLTQSGDEYVAAIRFGGYSSDEKIKENTEKLKTILMNKGIVHHGNFRYLGYNPPYQLFGRKNEIIVTVEWNKK